MTPPNEADAKEVAKKFLSQPKHEWEYKFPLTFDESAQVCSQLLELESKMSELEMHNTDHYCGVGEVTKERDALKAELKAANERCGKFEKALNEIHATGQFVHSDECFKIAFEALRPAQQREGE